MDIYKKIPFLFKKSEFVRIQIFLNEEKKLKRFKRKNIKENEKKTFERLWRKWDNNELSDLKFLEQISYIYINY